MIERPKLNIVQIYKLNCQKKTINALDLCDEIENLAPYITETKYMNASTVLHYLFSHGLHNLFPNITVALRIFLTMPKTVASGEDRSLN